MENKIKLLVLDDEPNIVEYVSKIFKLSGLEVFGTLKAEEAISLFKNNNPDICILDIYLIDSQLDGLDVLAEIRKTNKDTICIMFTRIMEDSAIQRANELGIYDYLLKPLDPSRLKQAVQNAVQLVERKNKK